MRALLTSGGEEIAIVCDDERISAAIEEGADGALRPLGTGAATVSVIVERDRRPFTTDGWSPLARGAAHRAGTVVVRDVCTSGVDLHARVVDGVPELIFRRRPPAATRAAGSLLPARARLLLRCVLLQYPALWWAGTRERVPLHASLLRTGGVDVVVGGASGVGKSTLVRAELSAGAATGGDNLCVTDGRKAWGIVEPLRVEDGDGRRMPHGRRECHLAERVPAFVPEVVALLRRCADGRGSTIAIDSRAAGRSLAAGTYTAGELRRYWPFAALLAMGTGAGPVHPPVTAVTRVLADRVTTFEVALGRGPSGGLAQLLATPEALPA
jgi:hypothetical protein